MSADIVTLTGSLYDFVLQTEARLLTRSRRRVGDSASHLLEPAQRLLTGFAEARDRASERLNGAISDVCKSLRELVNHLESRSSARREVKDTWATLCQHYESLRFQLRQLPITVPRDVQFDRVKPRNLWRNAFHCSMGVGAVLLYELVLTRGQLLVLGASILGIFAALDVSRRLSPAFNERLVAGVFGRISRPDEAHRIPSATWYLLALVLGLAIFPQPAIVLGALVLAVGDPAASLAGKRWGRLKLFRDRSLAGSLAFFSTAILICGLYLTLALPDPHWTRVLAVAGGVALVGALTELFTFRLDDNFTIPLAAAAMATVLLA